MIKRKYWHYSGDMSLEYGGFFYNLDNWEHNYAEAVRVTPCADAGGPDNMFWIERIVVNIPEDQAKLDEALKYCGWLQEPDVPAFSKLTRARKRHMVVDACLAYGYYDPDDCYNMSKPQRETVQIGPDNRFFRSRGWNQPSDIKRLRDGTNLRNYVRREWLNT